MRDDKEEKNSRRENEKTTNKNKHEYNEEIIM